MFSYIQQSYAKATRGKGLCCREAFTHQAHAVRRGLRMSSCDLLNLSGTRCLDSHLDPGRKRLTKCLQSRQFFPSSIPPPPFPEKNQRGIQEPGHGNASDWSVRPPFITRTTSGNVEHLIMDRNEMEKNANNSREDKQSAASTVRI